MSMLRGYTYLLAIRATRDFNLKKFNVCCFEEVCFLYFESNKSCCLYKTQTQTQRQVNTV